MNPLEAKLASYINNLQRLPNCNFEDLYRWADFVELKCLANADSFFSISDFIDVAKPNSEDLGQGDFEEMELERTHRVSKSEKNDRWEILAKDIFNIIDLRCNIFNSFYPFTLTENQLGIQLKEDLEINEKKYLFLLLSSNLQFAKDFKTELTGSFEYMSREVLINYLPENAIVNLFGSSNSEKNESWVITETKLYDKLKYLEHFLKGKLIITEEEINKNNIGDGGLDLVGIIPMGDSQSHFPMIFGQCACSPTEWLKKQSDIKLDNWRPKIHLNTTPLYFMFIPQNYRNATGEWFRTHEIRETILIDRQRILYGFNQDEKFQNYSSYKIVEEIINVKEKAF